MQPTRPSGAAMLWRTLLFTVVGLVVVAALLLMVVGEMQLLGLSLEMKSLSSLIVIILLIANGLLFAPILGAIEGEGSLVERIRSVPGRYANAFRSWGRWLGLAMGMVAVAALYLGVVQLVLLIVRAL